MSNYYEALRKIMSDGKLKKPKIRDLIREAGETDTKPTKVRRVRTKKETSKRKRLNQFGGTMDDIDLDRELEIGRDIDLIYDALLPKEKVGNKPVRPVRRSDKWDPVAHEETDLLAKYAKEDSLQQARSMMQGGDKWQETLFKATNPNISSEERWALLDLGMKQRMAKALSDDDISYIIDNAKYLNQQGRAALEEMIINRKDPGKAFALEKSLKSNPSDIDMMEIDQDARINEALDKLAGKREIIDEASVGGFSDNITPELTGMRVADDQMFGNELFDIKLKDRTSQNRAYDSSFDKFLTQEGVDVSGTDRYNRAVLDEMIRLAKERQAIDRNDVLHTRRNLHKDPVMRDKLDDRGTLPVEAIEAYKERNPGKAEQFLNYLRRDFAKKKSENPELKDREIMKLLANDWVPNRKGFGMVTVPKDVHPGNPRGNAKVTDSMRISYLEQLEARRDKLMSKLTAARSQGNEDVIDNLMEQLDDVNDKIITQKDFEKSIIDAENNREAEMIMDQFESPDVLEKKNPKPMNESMAWHNELDYYDKQAAKQGRKYGKKQTKDERRKQIEAAIANLNNNGFGRNVNLYRGSIKARLKKVSDRKILEEMLPSEAAGLSETPDVIEYLTPETRALFAEVNRREKNAAKKARAMAYPRSKNWSSKDYASFAKGKLPKMSELDKISAEEEVFRELSKNRALSKEFKEKHRDTRKITVSNKIPVEEGKNVSKLNRPASETFVKNAAKEHGFELTEKHMKDLLRMTRQEVIDFMEDLANP